MSNPLEVPDSLAFRCGVIWERERIIHLLEHRFQVLISSDPHGWNRQRKEDAKLQLTQAIDAINEGG